MNGRPRRVLVIDPSCVYGGVESFSCNLLQHLAAERHWDVIWMAPTHRMPALRARIGELNPIRFASAEWEIYHTYRWFDVVARRVQRFLPTKVVQAFSYFRNWLSQQRMQYLARNLQCEVCLCLWTLSTKPPKIGLPVVSVIHDLNWRHFPENFPRQSPDELDNEVVAWMRASKYCVTISDSVAEELRCLTPKGVDPAKVVPLAASPPPDTLWDEHSGAESSRIFAHLIYPGTVSPHKNHGALLSAIRRIATKDRNVRLILTGFGTDQVLKLIPDPENREWSDISELIVGLGYVSPMELAKHFCSADLAVLPSLYEGFGLPLVEALGFGVVVLHSGIPPFMEQVRLYQAEDQAFAVDATSASALAEAIYNRIKSPRPSSAQRMEWSRRVQKTWNWTKVAIEYDHLLQSATL